jgi:putative hydrolase of the HAD superfamily
MIFEYFFFDFDDTLYNYSYLHDKIIKIIINKYDLNYDIVKHIINNTCNISFKHNKLFYMNYELLPKTLFQIYNEYNDYIINNIKLYDGVLELFKFIKNKGKKIGIITNNLLSLQLIKLNKLCIIDYIDFILTSEEAQYEKPHKNIYELALGKTGMTKDKVCMIGDNLSHDIYGANDIGIYGYYYNKNGNNDRYCIKKMYTEFSCFNILLKLLNNTYNTSNEFIKLSIKYGQHVGLTQYNGGNISIKMDDIMLVKSSGIELGNINENGITYINNELLKENLSNNNEDIPVICGNKASIETYFHSILKKYVVHIHPAIINGILCEKNAESILERYNFKYKYYIIKYYKPGYKLSYEIYKKYDNHDIIFMLNHGIIITADDIKTIDDIFYDILTKFNLLNIKNSLIINNYFKSPVCIYQTYNNIIINNINDTIYNICPDYTLYLTKPIIYNSIDDILHDTIKIPSIIKVGDDIFIISENIKRCKLIEDIYTGYLMTIGNINDINLLKSSDVDEILNWDAEKYRKNI